MWWKIAGSGGEKNEIGKIRMGFEVWVDKVSTDRRAGMYVATAFHIEVLTLVDNILTPSY